MPLKCAFGALLNLYDSANLVQGRGYFSFHIPAPLSQVECTHFLNSLAILLPSLTCQWRAGVELS